LEASVKGFLEGAISCLLGKISKIRGEQQAPLLRRRK